MLAAIPVLARLYDVGAFGVFGIFGTASAALALAAAARFEQGIVPAISDRAAAAVMHLSVAIVVVVCMILAGGIYVAMPAAVRVVPSAPMRAALYWLPLGIGSQALGQILLQSATRQHRDGAIARYYGERALIMSSTQVALGAIGIAQNGLILGQIAGFSVASLLLWRRLPRSRRQNPRAMLRSAVQAARSRLDFPRYGMPRTLLEAAATIAQPIVIAALYGSAAMGGYWMAMRILGLPGSVLGDPIRQVFFRKAAERQRAGQPLAPLITRAFLNLNVVTVPFAAVLLIGSRTIFSILLGPAWMMAAVFVKLLAIAWLATFAAGLLPPVMILLGLQKQHFGFEIILRALQTAALLAGSVLGGILASLALLVVVDIAYVGALLRVPVFPRGTLASLPGTDDRPKPCRLTRATRGTSQRKAGRSPLTRTARPT